MLKRVADSLIRVLSPISLLLNQLSMVALTGAMLIVVVDVIMRRLFKASIVGSHDLTLVIFSIVVFAPMAWCTLQDRHVDLAILVNHLPKGARKAIDALMMLLTVILLGITCWQLLKQGLRLQSMGAETSVLLIPMYPFVYLATFGVFLMTLSFFAKFLITLNEMTKRGQ